MPAHMAGVRGQRAVYIASCSENCNFLQPRIGLTLTRAALRHELFEVLCNACKPYIVREPSLFDCA
jgi:hypothetical protein